MENESKEKNGPVKKIKIGRVEVSVWRNVNDVKVNGKTEERVFFNTSVVKNYFDANAGKKGEWKTSNSFSVTELPKVILALMKAQEYILMEAGHESDTEKD